jgi:opacity protein-like surface antigen
MHRRRILIMGRLKALTFASVLALGAATAAQAADLLPPPPPLEAPPLRGAVVEESGFYLRVDAGIANTNADRLRSTFGDGTTLASQGAVVGPTSVSVGDAALLGLGAGYQFNSWFRVDVTGEYRSATAYRSNVSAQWPSTSNTGCQPNNANGNAYCSDDYTGQIKTGLVLANGYLDMGTWYGFTPYVGAGVGLAAYQTSGVKDTTTFASGASAAGAGWGYAPNYTGVNLAWAAMAGVAYHITPNLLLDVGYRYVNMGTFKTGAIACNAPGYCHFETQHFDMASNDVRVGLRWLMAGPVYDAGYPVRAKY